jgi:hypothetical protein
MLSDRTPPQFVSAEGRPTYVDASAIAPNSGQISSPNETFLGGGISVASKGRTRASRIAITVRPFDFISTKLAWSLTYARQFSESQKSEFESVTHGDPYRVSWRLNGLVPRHTLQGFARFRLNTVVELAGGFSVQAGTQFTPLIGADVNGDGRSNDGVNTAVVTSLVGGTFDDAPRNIRQCFAKPIATVSELRCPGPSQVQSNMEARIQLPRMGMRASQCPGSA